MSSTSDLDATFAALADGTRRAILKRLIDGDVGLSDLAVPFEMTQTAVSKHVGVLRDAGLVEVEKRGRIRYCRLDAARLESASHWLSDYEAFWTKQIANIADHLESQEEE